MGWRRPAAGIVFVQRCACTRLVCARVLERARVGFAWGLRALCVRLRACVRACVAAHFVSICTHKVRSHARTDYTRVL